MSVATVRGLVLPVLLAFAGSVLAHVPPPADCDAPGFERRLQATPATPVIEAHAYWLNRELLKWPGVGIVETEGGRFKLYHAVSGSIVAAVGARVVGADGALELEAYVATLPEQLAQRFRFVADGPVLRLPRGSIALTDLHKRQLVLVQEDQAGRVIRATALQAAGALDDLYAGAADVADFGVSVTASTKRRRTGIKLWAPTAQRVSVCIYDNGDGNARAAIPMRFDAQTGVWSWSSPMDLSGQYYTYLVDVFVPRVGLFRNRVTDPYSISLTTDSLRSYIANLNAARFKPKGWNGSGAPATAPAATDMVIYELHVRDFSINDPTVSPPHRGKYLAFTEPGSNGMHHLKALADAGLTDVHLLPVFDFASVPEAGCKTPNPHGAPDGAEQQAAVAATKAADCFNWGYDPYHYTAPEGSYATDAADGARRIVEFRQMVLALHRTGLRVGMDVVYNHTAAAGQHLWSVLDRIVPGYYQRLNAAGEVETSTCCFNTATEHLMMGKLMTDSVLSWARDYGIDSFRFDLMGHQPRALMEQLKARLKAVTGRDIHLIGEGWNFGEVADGARFIQATQLSLNGSGIATFSDRMRDAVRGGGPSDRGERLVTQQGYINGLVYDRNAHAADNANSIDDLKRAADMVRVGLAGSIRDYPMKTYRDVVLPLERIDYNGQPAGYASQPGEVVNYVENHDNHTLFDINALKLPGGTSREDRARVQILGAAIVAFSQGVAYFHAGIDTLRSKSLDGNSYDSGDWFNRLDWSYADNYFGSGLPPQADNGGNWPLLRPLLADPAIKPSTANIAWTRDAFRDLLKIRASSSLFHLSSADEIKKRLAFYNTGSAQEPTVLVGHLDGKGYPGAAFKEILYLINVDVGTRRLKIEALAGRAFELHPVLAAAADPRPKAATYDRGGGEFTVPARTAVVLVVR
ncbi:MAG: DUF3372 domain-containing protein [Proteobacteria bacterium]|nr:DUF3372 domain-containing protein [Pseudomonadota bacterium]